MPDPADDPEPGRITRWRQDAVAKGSALEEQITTRVPKSTVVMETRRRFRRLNGPVLAGHLAFRTFLFLLPLAVFFVAVAGYFSASGHDVGAEVDSQLTLGAALSKTITDTARTAQDGRVGLMFTAVFGLVFGALGVTSALYYAFSQVWEIPIRKIDGKLGLLLRFIGVVVLVMGVLVFSASARNRGPLVGLGAHLAQVGLVFGALLILSWMLPRRADGLVWLVPGAIVGAIGMLGLHLVAVYYLPNKVQSASALYGSLGVIVSLLFYLFCLSNIIIVTAFVNAAWWDHHHDGDTSGGGPPQSAAATPAAVAGPPSDPSDSPGGTRVTA